MIVTETELPGCLILEPRIFEDPRGHFFESYNARNFEAETGKAGGFVQDNQSYSKYGVIRALHYQKGPDAQAKLVRVLQGRVLDVAVDLREGSPTFGKHVAVELSDDNRKQLYIPRGFAHGFSVLSETAVFFYKCDNFYNPESEGGIYYADPELAIDWGVPAHRQIVHGKDRELPGLREAEIVW